jgi:hypothetical protein
MARNLGVKQLGNTLKPLAGSRVQISPPANSNYDVKAEFGNPNSKSSKAEDFRGFLRNPQACVHEHFMAPVTETPISIAQHANQEVCGKEEDAEI